MAVSRLVNSFRVRLLLLLAALLVLTLSVQYYVNLREVRRNTQFIVEQQKAIMAGVALLQSHPKPTREQICHALEGNLCRCTGYSHIVDAITYAAKKVKSVK